MATTIQVSQVTKQFLDQCKRKFEVKSYDAVIQNLAQEKKMIPKSLFGIYPGTGWTKKDRMQFREL